MSELNTFIDELSSLQSVQSVEQRALDDRPDELEVLHECKPHWGLPKDIHNTCLESGFIIIDYQPNSAGMCTWIADATKWATYTQTDD